MKLILILLLCEVSIFGAASTSFRSSGSTTYSAPAVAIADSALKGYWRFDGNKFPWSSGTAVTATDSSGNAKTLTSTGTWAIGTGTQAGAVGQAARFNGVGRLAITDASFDNLETQGGGGMSVCFWANPSSAVNNAVICGKGTTGTWNISQSTTTTPMRFVFVKDGSTDGNASWGSTIDLNEWHFYVLTWDGSTTFSSGCKMYKDGDLRSQTAATSLVAPVSDAGNPFSVGGYTLSQTYQGGLDEFRVYNRVLSQVEVVKIYLSSVTKYAATGIGYNVAARSADALIDFEGGVDGALMTSTASLTNTIRGAALFSSWTNTVTNVFTAVTFSSLGQRNLLNPVTIDATNYAGGGSLGMRITPNVGAAREMIIGNLVTDVDQLNVSFRFMTTIDAPISASQYDLVHISDDLSTETFVTQFAPSLGIRAHKTAGGTTFGANTRLQPGKWYVCSMQFNKNGTGWVYTYAVVNPDDIASVAAQQLPAYFGQPVQLIGVSQVTLANVQAGLIRIGCDDHVTNPTGDIYIDNVVVGGTFPLQP